MSVFLFTTFPIQPLGCANQSLSSSAPKNKDSMTSCFDPSSLYIDKDCTFIKRQNASVLETEINTITPF